jgi:hypothetical protein
MEGTSRCLAKKFRRRNNAKQEAFHYLLLTGYVTPSKQHRESYRISKHSTRKKNIAQLSPLTGSNEHQLSDSEA